MVKKIQLQIPTPCHENWEKMTATEKGRFCSSCQKTVVDFSNKSDREIALFFKKTPTGVCGRFLDEQLEREIEIPKKRIPWLKYFLQFLIPAMFFSLRLNAQRTSKHGVSKSDSTYTIFTGKATLLQLPRKKHRPEPMTILPERISQPLLRIDTPEVHIRPLSSQPVLVFVALGGVVSGVKIIEHPVISFVKWVTSSNRKGFNIYPNPLPRNSTLQIAWSQIRSGRLVLELYNESGQAVFTKEIDIDKGITRVTIERPGVPAGSYFIRITGKSDAKASTQRLIIQ